MAASVTGSLLIVRLSNIGDPVVATYRIAFAPGNARLRGRYVTCEGLDALTELLRKAAIPIPEIERVWQALARRRFHSVPRVTLTLNEIDTLGL